MRAPPRSFSARMVPPSALTTWATMARPRPDPGSPRAAGGAVEAVEDVRQVLLGDARAVVAHHHRPRPGSATDTDCPGGLHLRALSSRLPTARDSRSASASTQHASASSSKRHVLRPGRGCSGTATASRTSRSRRSGSGGRRAAGRPGPARPGRRPGRSAPGAARARRRPARSGPSSLSSSTRRITSRLVRRLVSGVRSSWEASRTSWLWARRDDSSASSSRLKVRRRRPSSSGPPGESRRETSVVSARSSTVSVSELSGTSAVRATSQPRTTASRTPTRATAPSSSARRSSSRADVEQGGDLQRAALDEDARRRPACRPAGARRARGSGSRPR